MPANEGVKLAQSRANILDCNVHLFAKSTGIYLPNLYWLIADIRWDLPEWRLAFRVLTFGCCSLGMIPGDYVCQLQ